MFKRAATMLASVIVLSGHAKPENEVSNRIESVGLFKNGVAIVRHEIKVPANGTYILKKVPKPVHGTFWVESDATVITRMSKRWQTVKLPPREMTLEERLAGKNVRFTLEGETLSGKVIKDDTLMTETGWNTDYQPGATYYANSVSGRSSASKSNYLTLKTDKETVLFSATDVSSIHTETPNTTVRRLRPVMAFDVTNADKNATITVSYLTKGLSWVPSYRVNLKSKDQLTIEQKAVIKNEFGDLSGSQVHIISGFPNVKFANVTSPLSTEMTWSSFFQQLSQRPNWRHASMSNVITQQAISYNDRSQSGGDGVNVPVEGEGVDIHYQPLGSLDLKEGSSLALTVSKKGAAFERLVEWVIPDTRDANGRYINNYSRRNNPGEFRDTAWDSIRFKNPFDFPMTTAPLMITRSHQFLGQTLSFWANPGEPNIQHITKALSVRTRHTEQEVKGKREVIYIAGDDYQKAQVEGKVLVSNTRSTPIKILIKRQFSGALDKADGSPKDTLLEDGVFSVNERHQLVWELTLEPGKSKEINYTYTVLVNR